MVYPYHFEETFLTVPRECLILTMQTNQKYFVLTDAQGRLRNRFLIVSNITTDTPEVIIQGSEHVVRPHLAGARFLLEQNKKKPLTDHIPLPSRMVYHSKIGTQLERMSRLQTVAGQLTEKLGADVAHASRGTLLAKADLLTDMMGEFPELQGTMRAYYTRHDGEPDDVALACSEHYQPCFADDALPSIVTGTVVALADKLETLVGVWGIGPRPTDERGPFALCRHTLDILCMLIEKSLTLTIDDALQIAATSFDGIAAVRPNLTAIADFLYDRLHGHLKDKGYSTNEIEAMVGQRPQRLDDIVARLEAACTFAALPQAETLMAVNKRITNILKRTGMAIGAMQPPLLKEDAERALYQSVVSAGPQVHDAFARGDFTTALRTLAGLRKVVDTFFNGVMVMADDTTLHDNHLVLLAELHGLMNRVTDIFKLVV